MFTYQILVEYSGTKFFGWQKQKKGKTVQGTLERVLSKFLKACKDSEISGEAKSEVESGQKRAGRSTFIGVLFIHLYHLHLQRVQK